MTLFKHTEPPKEKGIYLCEMPYDGSDVMTMVLARWMGDRWDTPNIKHYFSKVPPKEIELALSALKHNFLLNEMKYSTLSKESTEALLKLREE